MPVLPANDTVFALATPPVGSRKAIVRVSGPRAFSALENILGEVGKDFHEWTPGRILRASVTLDDARLPVELYKMKTPRSYTGEDMAEIHCAASLPILAKLLDTLRSAGLRSATPGEFTRRAFLSGKIDLARVEGVSALIRARDENELKNAARLARGEFSDRLADVRDRLTQCAALVEINIDFSDQDIDLLQNSALIPQLRELENRLAGFIESETGRRVESGEPRIVLAGLANAGKSTLFNALIGENRAIVSSIPGTTRDSIASAIRIGKHTARLVDTAGFKSAETPLDDLSWLMARQNHDDADILLWVADCTAGPGDEKLVLLKARARPKHLLLVLNKCDAPHAASDPWRKSYSKMDCVSISALRGAGLDVLRARLAALLEQATESSSETEISARHLECLQKARAAVESAVRAAEAGFGEDLIAADLHHALRALGEITGEWVPDDLLDHIFSRFCIGK